ncbi:MAG: SRPBCC domain-containing protein [Bacteroidota bacterium]
MVKNISLIQINSSKENVWDALTNPQLVKQWQFGSDLLTDWQVGSDIRFSTAWEGKLFEQWGKVLEVKMHEILRYSLFAPRPGLEDIPENYFIMSYLLTPEKGGTRLEIIQDDNRPGAVQEELQGEENAVLLSLKNLIEKS